MGILRGLVHKVVELVLKGIEVICKFQVRPAGVAEHGLPDRVHAGAVLGAARRADRRSRCHSSPGCSTIAALQAAVAAW